MVCRVKGESTAPVSPSPPLRSLLPLPFPFLFSSFCTPPRLHSSFFITLPTIFYLKKKQTVFCISNKPPPPPPLPSDIWFYSPPSSTQHTARVSIFTKLGWYEAAAARAGALWQVHKVLMSPLPHPLHPCSHLPFSLNLFRAFHFLPCFKQLVERCCFPPRLVQWVLSSRIQWFVLFYFLSNLL